MIEDLPVWIPGLFLAITILSIVLFHYANGKPKKLTRLIILWSLAQGAVAFFGFYEQTDQLPPRFLCVLIPIFIVLAYGMSKKALSWVKTNRNLYRSTFFHTLRFPVEIVLYYLFLENMVPELMTFEGRNLDILAGLTAPIVAILFHKKILGTKILIIWNLMGLFLILFVFTNGILSSELPIQQFAFDQPTKAPNYFPFVLLPATVVPMVIYLHITDMLTIWSRNKRLK